MWHFIVKFLTVGSLCLCFCNFWIYFVGTTHITQTLVTSHTQKAVHERRVFRCLSCYSLCIAPLSSEWLRPGNNGLFYNLARKQYGTLEDKKLYSFTSFVSMPLLGCKPSVLLSVLFWDCTVGCPEMSVTNYHCTLHKISKRPHVPFTHSKKNLCCWYDVLKWCSGIWIFLHRHYVPSWNYSVLCANLYAANNLSFVIPPRCEVLLFWHVNVNTCIMKNVKITWNEREKVMKWTAYYGKVSHKSF